MKRLHILFFLWLIGISVAWGQSKMSLIDFRCDETDLTANTYGTEKMDLNGEKCALIKIETTQKGFVFDCGSSVMPREVMYKPGQIWIYVPRGVKKLKIYHDRLGTLEYVFPMPIEKAKTYKVTLTAQNVAEIETETAVWVTLSVKNNVSAEIWLDGRNLGKGTWSGMLKSGKYTVECRKDNCYPSKKEISVYAPEGVRLTFDLTPPPPMIGSLFIMTTPSDGVRIWVDGEDKGLNPKTVLSVPVGEHRIKLEYDGYEPKEFTVNIERGKTIYVHERLSPYTNVWIYTFRQKSKKSAPKAFINADIWVDGELLRGQEKQPARAYLSCRKHFFYGSSWSDDEGRYYRGAETIDINQANQSVLLRLKPRGLRVLEDVFYGEVSCQMDFYRHFGWGMGVSLGGYTIDNVNIETLCSIDFSNYDVHFGVKTGYGLQIGSWINLTPQAGLGWRTIFFDGHAFTIDAALRFSMGNRVLRFLLIPEYGFIFASIDYPRLSLLKAWRHIFGIRCGFAITL